MHLHSSMAGGSFSAELVADDELFVRWLGIAAFLPVISFQTPPWVFEKEWVSAARTGPRPYPGLAFSSVLTPPLWSGKKKG